MSAVDTLPIEDNPHEAEMIISVLKENYITDGIEVLRDRRGEQANVRTGGETSRIETRSNYARFEAPQVERSEKRMIRTDSNWSVS